METWIDVTCPLPETRACTCFCNGVKSHFLRISRIERHSTSLHVCAEAVVNSRPLTAESITSPGSAEALTPNHFLTLKTKVVLPPPGVFKSATGTAPNQWILVPMEKGIPPFFAGTAEVDPPTEKSSSEWYCHRQGGWHTQKPVESMPRCWSSAGRRWISTQGEAGSWQSELSIKRKEESAAVNVGETDSQAGAVNVHTRWVKTRESPSRSHHRRNTRGPSINGPWTYKL